MAKQALHKEVVVSVEPLAFASSMMLAVRTGWRGTERRSPHHGIWYMGRLRRYRWGYLRLHLSSVTLRDTRGHLGCPWGYTRAEVEGSTGVTARYLRDTPVGLLGRETKVVSSTS